MEESNEKPLDPVMVQMLEILKGELAGKVIYMARVKALIAALGVLVASGEFR